MSELQKKTSSKTIDWFSKDLNNVFKKSSIEENCHFLLKKDEDIQKVFTKPEKGGVPNNTAGIYTFKQNNKVIYLGMSSNDLRKRLQAHLNNNDGQEIGQYLQKWHFRKISVSWIAEDEAEIKEKQYVETITKIQGTMPKFNKTSGNAKKSDRRQKQERYLI